MKPLNSRQAKVLEALKDAAAKEQPCPTNAELAELCGFAHVGTPCKVLDQLEYMGLVRMVRGPNWRIATVLETGKSTYRSPSGSHSNQFRPKLRVVARPESVRSPDPDQPRVFRDPCPCCNTRLDADPALCCPRGRAIRKLVA